MATPSLAKPIYPIRPPKQRPHAATKSQPMMPIARRARLGFLLALCRSLGTLRLAMGAHFTSNRKPGEALELF